MGGSVSSGRSNDELIDNLVEGHLIKSPLVERVFRCIDRALYYLPASKDSAYRDLAWRDGVIHISAPCIYTRVMENLELKENLSFLNIGSGTGYLSSMVGLILGPNGVNHNIELHKELIDYAKQKTVEFVDTSLHFDDFDYCVPKFVQGNCMNLAVTSDMLLYDRIYVGAGVTDQEEQFLTSLLKIDGILIMPLNDSLVKIKRLDEKKFSKKSLMTVSFASLITTNVSQGEPFSMPRLNPLSLQDLCRYQIRRSIRKKIETEQPNYYKIDREMSTFNQKRSNKLISDEENESSESSDQDQDRDDDDEDEDDRRSETNDFPLTRFERLFRQRHINNVHENNLVFENQLRMMIYGQILDAAVSTNTGIILNNNNANTDSTSRHQIDSENRNQAIAELDDQMDHESETADPNEEEDEFISSDQLISTAVALMEVSASVAQNNEQNGIASEENELGSTESDLDNLTHSTESIQNTNLSTSDREEYDSSPTAIIDENNIASSLPTRSNVLAIGYTRSAIPIRRKRQISSGYQSTSTDFSSSLNENAILKLSSDESSSVANEKQKNESATDSNDSDHYFDDENDDEDYEISEKKSEATQTAVTVAAQEKEEEKEQEESDANKLYAINHVLQTSTQMFNNNCCSYKEANLAASGIQNKIVRKNLLREKVMQLPVSESLKKFLLYYRKI